MREPIKPEDIREGDTIRYERGSHYVHSDVAHEYVARSDGDRAGYGESKYYLLDRPASAVDLPTEPTLGWLTFHAGRPTRTVLGMYYPTSRGLTDECGAGEWPRECITAFTPAVPVPADALETFRGWVEDPRVEMLWGAGARIQAGRDFLAAIDAANGDPR